MEIDWTKLSVKKLEDAVLKHNHLYFIEHNPEISDYEFDKLVEELKSKKPDSKILKQIGSEISDESKKIEHPSEMLSLDKCYDDKTFENWTEKIQGDFIASPKIDGVAVRFTYDEMGKLKLAATRGDGKVGEDVTENVKHINDIPNSSSNLRNCEIRGEIYMRLSVFKKYSSEFANPRNLTAGAVKQKDPKKTGEYNLSFFAYDLLGTNLNTEEEKYDFLKKAKVPVVEWIVIPSIACHPESAVAEEGSAVCHPDSYKQAYDYFLKKRDSYDFETDGVVFRANSVSEKERLGNTAHHPRYAIAYKFQGDSGITKLIDIEWSISRTGAITPVGIVEPVILSGATVRRASLHNFGLIEKLGIKIGGKVLMMRRGGVIPNIEGTADNNGEAISPPNKCPSCNSDVIRKDDFLYCTDPKNCIRSKIGELKHFVQTVEIDCFGEKLLEKLYEEGLVTEIFDFYTLSANDLIDLERMGQTLAQKLIRNVQNKKEIPLDVFLRCLGIRELGKHSSKILAEFGSLEKLYELNEETLSEIKTIGPIIAKEVVEGLKNKKPIIDNLLKHIKIIENAPKKEGKFSGKSFLFTGTLESMDRKSAQKLVEEQGGIAANSVTKDLDYLVVGNEGKSSSKLKKANKLKESGFKVKVVSEDEFLEIIHD